jgi:uncharacterized protein (TIGR03067 family)
MKARWLVMLAALLSLAAYAPAPLPKPDKTGIKKEQKDLLGTWALVGLTRAGKAMGGPRNFDMKVVISKDRWAFVRGNTKAMEYNLTVGSQAKVRTMDLGRPGNAAPLIRAIFAVEGDTLKMCYYPDRTRTDRPLRFDPADPRQMVMILKRQKP